MELCVQISIHAPRGGSDLLSVIGQPFLVISIHAPRGGSDDWKPVRQEVTQKFQSTLPVGGATKYHH